MHGYTVSEAGEDPFLVVAEKALEGFYVATNPGRFWVDFIPWRESLHFRDSAHR